MDNIKVIKGDITTLDVDIIVNAANKTLLGGGGVDGAIHRRAGRELKEECRMLHGCNTGEAKMTKGYNLKARRVIHTVGPVYCGGNSNESELLRSCYKNSLLLAEDYRREMGIDKITIAFPCISTGIYHFPKRDASLIAVNTVKEVNNSNIEVMFVCYEDEDYLLYNDLIK